MKKVILYGATLLSLGMLIACSTTNKQQTQKNQTTSNSSPTTVTKKDDMEVKNGLLTKVGQWTKTADLGKITLLKIMDKPTKIQLTDGLTTTIESVKLFHADNITEFNSALIRTDKKSGNYVQIIASVENNTENEYKSIFPETIVLSNGIQIKHNRSFSTSTEVKPHAKNLNMLYFYFIDDQTPDSLRLYYDSITDEKGYNINEIKAETMINFNK